MSESRDRLSRPDNITAIFSHRRRSIGSMGILTDEPEGAGVATPSPLGWRPTATAGFTPRVRGGTGGNVGRGIFGTPRVGNGRGRSLNVSPAFARQNTPAGSSRRTGRGRSGGSVLPSWYPRRPLQDVTAIVRAIERTRARLREAESQHIGTPTTQNLSVLDPSLPVSDEQIDHDIYMISPNPTMGISHCQPSVDKIPKILLITNQAAGESDFLTPQKKLLNSIDTVEKVVMEELCKLKRTPTAKKAEREKRVRTLMSMR